MTIEFKCEEHSEKAHCAMAHLSGHYKPGFIRQVFADFGPTIITLRQITSKNKPREFSMTASEADAFVEAWEQFKDDIALWEAIEEDRAKRAELAEHARQLAVWKQIEQLAESIPRLEILARDENTENGTTTMWTVKHEAIDYSDMYNHTVDHVLACVQETIEIYNEVLKRYEAAEKSGWAGYNVLGKEQSQTFLATHRAFVASKTAPLVDVNT